MNESKLIKLIDALESAACQCDAMIAYTCPNHKEAQQARVLAKRCNRKLDGKFSMLDGEVINTISGEVIPDDEPIFLLRGRDANAEAALLAYLNQCVRSACTRLHIMGIEQVIRKFRKFAADFPDRIKEPTKTQHLQLDPTGEKYILKTNFFDRYIVVKADDQNLAWSGSQWVPIDGDVQISNFDDVNLAHQYAKSYGFELADQQLPAKNFRWVCNNCQHVDNPYVVGKPTICPKCGWNNWRTEPVNEVGA